MELKGSLPYSQLPATCLYSEPAQSSPYPHIPHPEDPSQYYPPLFAWVSPVALSHRFPHQNLTHAYLSSQSMLHAPPISFFLILSPAQYWVRSTDHQLLVMKFSPPPCYLVPFRPNTLLNTLFSNTLSLRSSLNVSVQVSHPYKTTDKIIILFIYMFCTIRYRFDYLLFVMNMLK
jgi:hypothetical protein